MLSALTGRGRLPGEERVDGFAFGRLGLAPATVTASAPPAMARRSDSSQSRPSASALPSTPAKASPAAVVSTAVTRKGSCRVTAVLSLEVRSTTTAPAPARVTTARARPGR